MWLLRFEKFDGLRADADWKGDNIINDLVGVGNG